MQEEAIVAVDTSVDLNEIGVVWIITNKRKTFEVKYKLFSNKQQRNIARAAEAVTLLDLIEIIIKRTEELTIRRIIIHTDNSKIHKIIYSPMDIINYFI